MITSFASFLGGVAVSCLIAAVAMHRLGLPLPLVPGQGSRLRFARHLLVAVEYCNQSRQWMVQPGDLNQERHEAWKPRALAVGRNCLIQSLDHDRFSEERRLLRDYGERLVASGYADANASPSQQWDYSGLIGSIERQLIVAVEKRWPQGAEGVGFDLWAQLREIVVIEARNNLLLLAPWEKAHAIVEVASPLWGSKLHMLFASALLSDKQLQRCRAALDKLEAHMRSDAESDIARKMIRGYADVTRPSAPISSGETTRGHIAAVLDAALNHWDDR